MTLVPQEGIFSTSPLEDAALSKKVDGPSVKSPVPSLPLDVGASESIYDLSSLVTRSIQVSRPTPYQNVDDHPQRLHYERVP